FPCDATWLLSIRAHISINESWRELCQGGDLLLLLFRAVFHEMPFTVLAPALRRGFRRDRSSTPLAIPRPVGQLGANIHLPATASVRSDCHAHHLLLW